MADNFFDENDISKDEVDGGSFFDSSDIEQSPMDIEKPQDDISLIDQLPKAAVGAGLGYAAQKGIEKAGELEGVQKQLKALKKLPEKGLSKLGNLSLEQIRMIKDNPYLYKEVSNPQEIAQNLQRRQEIFKIKSWQVREEAQMLFNLVMYQSLSLN